MVGGLVLVVPMVFVSPGSASSAGRTSATTEAAAAGLGGMGPEAATAAEATVAPNLAPIIEEPSVIAVGDWADDIFPALDELASDNPSVIAYVSTTAEGTVAVYATDVDAARSLVDAGLDALKASTSARSKIEVRSVKLNSDALMAVGNAMLKDPEYLAHGAGHFYIDYANDREVAQFTTTPSDDYRAELYRRFGDGIAIEVSDMKVSPQSGPERFKDRYPYWGAAGIAPPNFVWPEDKADCTAGVPMEQADGQDIMTTAGHCTSG